MDADIHGNSEELLFEYLRNVIYNPQKAALDRDALTSSQQKLAAGLEQLGEFTKEYYQVANALASGKLSVEIKERNGNPLTAPLKSIQANFAHLAYMSKLALREDSQQHVDYLGNLADSFNEIFTDIKDQRDRLLRGAYTDALTGAGNRLRFDIKLEEIWSKGFACTLAMVDVDDVSYCNEHMGRLEGDIYIMQVCNFLQSNLRNDEWLYRVGGDEFAILSIHSSVEKLRERLEKLRDAFIRKYISSVSYPCSFSFSCVEINPDKNDSYQKLLHKADKEMQIYKLEKELQHEQRMDTSIASDDASYVNLENDADKGLWSKRYGLDSVIFDALAYTSQKTYIFICNMRSNMSRWSANAVRDFGLPDEYMHDAGLVWLEHVHPDDRAAYLNELNGIFTGLKNRIVMQYRARNAKGVYVVCTSDAYVVKGEDGEPDFFAGTIVKSGTVSNVDSLTDLYNVYEFMNVLRRRRSRNGNCHILAFEICKFNSINSFYGFNVGSRVLVEFAEQLQRLLRNEDALLFRLSGVQFLIMVEGYDREMLDELWNKIAAIGMNDIYVRNKHVGFYCRAFALGLQYADMDVSVILSQIKNYLDQARFGDKDKLLFIDEEQNELLYNKIRKLSTIRASVLAGCRGFYMLYQPQTNRSGRVIGAEALLRWRNPEWGEVPPGDFIPVLENDVCFYELGLWILRTSMRDTKGLLEQNPDFELSVNVSYTQLDNASFHEDVLSIIEETGFPKENLVLEFTEHADAIRPGMLSRHVSFFHEHGIKIASDDFGTGYNALLMLKEVAFDEIKIDREFVKNIVEDQNDRILVRTLIDCMHQLGVRVCVEGIETQEVLDIIQDYGASIFQGYLFSRPTELENVSAMLKNSSPLA